jgi:hypothetical protein|tara:strand:- start:44 stop:316 length:273 start_codon:yes stop_codon:yes gene_type:complete
MSHLTREKKMNIRRNRFNNVTEINNESVLVNLNNQVFVTQRTINRYVISFRVYTLNSVTAELIFECRNSIAGVYRIAYRDAVELANGLAQ